MANDSKDPRQALADKRQRAAIEGDKARAEYEAQGVADRAKTARLRSLRLAKEAADQEAERAAAAAAKKPTKKAKRGAKSLPVGKLNASNDV